MISCHGQHHFGSSSVDPASVQVISWKCAVKTMDSGTRQASPVQSSGDGINEYLRMVIIYHMIMIRNGETRLVLVSNG